MAKSTTKKGKNITPLGDRVLLQEVEQEATTAAGIILPQSMSKDTGMKEATVVAVGPGRIEDGKTVKVSVNVGDTVLFQWGDEIKIDGQEYYLVSEGNIAAIVK